MVMVRCLVSNLNLSDSSGELEVFQTYVSSVFKALGVHVGDLPALESSEWRHSRQRCCGQSTELARRMPGLRS